MGRVQRTKIVGPNVVAKGWGKDMASHKGAEEPRRAGTRGRSRLDPKGVPSQGGNDTASNNVEHGGEVISAATKAAPSGPVILWDDAKHETRGG